MIAGFFRGGTPCVVAAVSIPLLGTQPGDVEFLIDTGAAITVLRFDLLERLGLDSTALNSMPKERNLGAGGSVVHARQRGQIAFHDDQGTDVILTTWLRFGLEPADEGAPSVLGMNALRTLRLVVSVPEGRVELQHPFA